MNLVPKSDSVSTIVSSTMTLGGGVLLLGLRAFSGAFPIGGVIAGGVLAALGIYTVTTSGKQNQQDLKGGSMSLLTGGLLIASIVPVIGGFAHLAMLAGGIFFTVTGGIRLLREKANILQSWRKRK